MDEQENQEKTGRDKVAIYYQKTRHYRTIHADGAWAGITPQLEVQFTFFTDLQPMPEFTLHQVTDKGTLSDEVERVVKDGVVREAEINIVMNPSNTEQLINLLQRIVGQIKHHQAKAEKNMQPGEVSEKTETSEVS